MNFADFRRSRIATASLWRTLPNTRDFVGVDCAGFVYVDELVIIGDGAHNALQINNAIWKSGRLTELESILFQFAIAERIVEDDSASQTVGAVAAMLIKDAVPGDKIKAALFANLAESDPEICHLHDVCDPFHFIAEAAKAAKVELQDGDSTLAYNVMRGELHNEFGGYGNA